MGSPSVKTIKRLFAVSGNLCAFPNCPTALIDPASGTVIGEVCHIKSRRVGGPQHDPSQTDGERNVFENLIAMCSPHHKVIDDDPDSYTVERLQQIKCSHEDKASQGMLSKDEQTRFLALLDERIQAILDRDKQSASDEIDTGPDARAILKSLAEKQRQKIDRKEWARSDQAVNDVINSINEIFTQFEDTTFSILQSFKHLISRKRAM